MTAEGGPTGDNVYTMVPFHVLDPVEYFDHKFGIVKLLIVNEDVKVKCTLEKSTSSYSLNEYEISNCLSSPHYSSSLLLTTGHASAIAYLVGEE
jgi:hypothetical protein